MNCPNCNKEMKYEDKGYWGYPFTTGPEPDYPDYFKRDIYTCKECKIMCDNKEWKIPKKYERPTEKQLNTVLFINKRLGLTFEPLLKVQCWRFINKFFNKAKVCKYYIDEQMTKELKDMYEEFEYY